MLDTGLEGNDIEPTWRQGYGPGAYIRLASETSYYWSRSPTLVTMEPFANSYHAGYSPGGRWYWITTRIWASIRVWIPLPPSPYHTHTHADVQIIIHMYDNIRMISTIAFCVLLSSFSSFLAISRLRSLNKEDDENIILLITYDMQRRKGKALSTLHSPVSQSLRKSLILQVTKYWMVGELVSSFWSLAVCKNESSHPILQVASDQKLEPGKAWEWG